MLVRLLHCTDCYICCTVLVPNFSPGIVRYGTRRRDQDHTAHHKSLQSASYRPVRSHRLVHTVPAGNIWYGTRTGWSQYWYRTVRYHVQYSKLCNNPSRHVTATHLLPRRATPACSPAPVLRRCQPKISLCRRWCRLKVSEEFSSPAPAPLSPCFPVCSLSWRSPTSYYYYSKNIIILYPIVTSKQMGQWTRPKRYVCSVTYYIRVSHRGHLHCSFALLHSNDTRLG